ncbi:50S ribosomal protein L15 [Candidatus Dojkabacteria bacterium]|nr:50S ribosomal protein L15 [Candidatus Dojkabacteria bacterium]
MLNNLISPKTKKKSKIIGRGYGSGVGGHTVGKGQKGQKSRSGYSKPRPGFEGGQMPLSRRLPKLRGFKRGYFKSKSHNTVLNLSDLEGLGLTRVSFESLKEKGLLGGFSKKQEVKILSGGKISRKVEIVGIKISKKAQEKVEKAGGKVTA